MRIAFYIDNSAVSEVDFSHPQHGNPGVGGTEFLFMSQPHYLQKYAKKHGLDYEFILLANEISKIPPGTVAYSVHSDQEAVEKAKELNVDIFVFRPMEDDISSGRLRFYTDSEIKLVGWAHNSYSRKLLAALNCESNYKAHICVSHEQLDELLDKQIYDKSTFIYNGFESFYAEPIAVGMRSAVDVVYIGSIIPAKGFHMLAEAWPRVLKRVPKARLKVIGSGKVYNRKAALGEYCIAEAEYEARFIPYLKGADGKIMPSVQFLGLMGTSKFDVMKQAAIGVVNPTGVTENCPGSALEFQACGVPVVSAAKRGLWDTVADGRTGLLVRDIHGLVDAIVTLLDSKDLNQRYGRSAPVFVREKFDYENVCAAWHKLFDLIDRDICIHEVRPRFKNKLLKERRLLRLLLRLVGKLGYWRK